MALAHERPIRLRTSRELDEELELRHIDYLLAHLQRVHDDEEAQRLRALVFPSVVAALPPATERTCATDGAPLE